MLIRLYSWAPAVLLVIFFFAAPSFSAEDPCKEDGIVVKNLTMLDLWYKKNNGACTIWIKNHIFKIKPEDTYEIFSDMVCEKRYCPGNPAYSDYKSLDENGNCGVRILPDCNLSDM